MRALKRRLSNLVYARMVEDQQRRQATGPAGHSGTTLQSSVTDLTPDIGTSDKPLPGPASPQPRAVIPAASSHKGVPEVGTCVTPQRRASAPVDQELWAYCHHETSLWPSAAVDRSIARRWWPAIFRLTATMSILDGEGPWQLGYQG